MVSPDLRLLSALPLLGILGGGCGCFHDTRYASENSNLRDDARLFVAPRCDPTEQYACGLFRVVVDAKHPLPSALRLELAPACAWPISPAKPSTPDGFWRFEAELECGALVPERRHHLVVHGKDSVYAESDFRYIQFRSESCSE